MLTDQTISDEWRKASSEDDSWMPQIHERFARAIEAAATEPLLERIAALGAKLSQRVPDGWTATEDQYPPPGVRVFWMNERSNQVGYDTWAGEDFRFAASHWMHIPPLSAAPAAHEQQDPTKRCPNCDDTGDVHSVDGEWRGTCHCPAGQALKTKPVVQAPNAQQAEHVPETNCGNSQQAEAQEPFAWSVIDGDGGYDLLLYEGNEDFREQFEARNPKYKNWVAPLFTRPQPAHLERLSEEDVHDWWSYENGMEDHDMCKMEHFRDAVRQIENELAAKNGVNLK